MVEVARVTISPPAGPSALTWRGKTVPQTVTPPPVHALDCYGPAQADQIGDEPSGANQLFWGDNREMAAHLLATGWRERIRLIYIDPPYDSRANYARKVRLRNPRATILTRQVQYRDQWPGEGSYLQFIYERLLILRDLVAPDGCIWLHSDYRQMHRLHLLLEEVFGPDNYLNTISWRSQVARGAKVNAFYFPHSTQFIGVFAKDRRTPTRWHPQRKQLIFTRRQAAAQFMEDEGGFFRTSDPGTYSFAKLKQLHADGRLYAPFGGEIVIDEAAQRVYASAGGNIGVKYYLTQNEDGRYSVERAVDNLWDDIPGLGTTPGEDVGYPTQKTVALLRRIIGASTDPGDWVLDAFAGSGTTPLVAEQMGRRWLACDDNYGAIQTMRRRLPVTSSASFLVSAVGDCALPNATRTDPSLHVEMEIHRAGVNQDTIAVEIHDVRSDAVGGLLAERGLNPRTAWREFVEAIEIDIDFDGCSFRPVLIDAPLGKRTQVEGVYVLAAPIDPTTVGVRIADVLGNEVVVSRRL